MILWMLISSVVASATCSFPDMEKQIEKRSKPESPIQDCRLDFNAAKRCCFHPEKCKIPPGSTARQQAENEMAFCKKHVQAARRSCRHDQRHRGLLKDEFRKVLNCTEDRVADMNGMMIKSASEKRHDSAPLKIEKTEGSDVPTEPVGHGSARDGLPQEVSPDAAMPAGTPPRQHND